jgi:hypothetical protein
MKVIVDIQDKQAEFGIEVLKSLSFIKKAKPISAASAKLWGDLTEAADEVRQHKKGKLKLKTAKELLSEL